MTLTRRVLTEKRRYIYPLLLAVLVNIGLLLAVLYPLTKKVTAAGQQARDASAALLIAKRDHAAARATVSGKDSADAELKKFYNAVLPPDQSAARRLTFVKIDELARASNLTRRGGNTKSTHDRDSALGKLTVTHTLSGQYRDIRRFIHQLETTPDFLILEDVRLIQGTDSGGPLNLTVQVATYYWTGANEH